MERLVVRNFAVHAAGLFGQWERLIGVRMSKTIIDMPKVAQMLDAKWEVFLFKNSMGSYSAVARHGNHDFVGRMKAKIVAAAPPEWRDTIREELESDRVDTIETDDFTPEQALTRLAYKVHGEII